MESSPIGVIFGVEPWNFPYYQLARDRRPASDGGQHAGGEARRHRAAVRPGVREAAARRRRAGRPLHQPVHLPCAQSDQVVDDPRIKGVCLTGSVAAGQSVAARSREEPQGLLHGAGRQRRLHRAGRRGPRPHHPLGGVGPDVQYRPNLLRGQAFHCGGTASPTSSWSGSRRRFERAQGRAIRWTRRPRSAPCPAKSALVAARGSRSMRRRRPRAPRSADRRQAHRSSRRLHAAVDPDRHQAGEPCVSGRVLRPGGPVLPGQGRGGRDCPGQRLRFWTGRLGLDQGCRARQARGQPWWRPG